MKDLVKIESKDIEIFEHEKFGEVEVFIVDGITRFIGKQIALKLDYTNPLKAVRDHCSTVNKMFIVRNGKTRKVSTITEGDVIRLVVRSKMKKAKEFESWIFDEVIPTIIKTGGYINDVNKFMDNYLDELDDEQSKIVLKGLTKKVDKLKERAILYKQKIEEQKGKIFELEDDKNVLQNQNDQLVKHNDTLYDRIDNKYHTYCTTELFSITKILNIINSKLNIKLRRKQFIKILIDEEILIDTGNEMKISECSLVNHLYGNQTVDSFYLYESKVDDLVIIVNRALINKVFV